MAIIGDDSLQLIGNAVKHLCGNLWVVVRKTDGQRCLAGTEKPGEPVLDGFYRVFLSEIFAIGHVLAWHLFMGDGAGKVFRIK